MLANVTSAKAKKSSEEEHNNYVVAFTRDDFVAQTLSPTMVVEDMLLFDTGASVSACPRLYTAGYPLILDESPPRLKTVTGQAIMTYGVRKITYVLHARATLTCCARGEDASSFSFRAFRQSIRREDKQR